MAVFQHADLLVNVHTLDDVTAREDFCLPEAEAAFVNLVEAAALEIAECHFDGDRKEGAAYVDWNGSRLQFWVSYSRRIYELVVFQFDLNERSPLVCCASQDFVFGSRSLTAQFAVMGNGHKARVERLPNSDLRRRRRAPTPAASGSAVPTLHRVEAAVRGLLGRIRDRLWRAAQRAGTACLALARRAVGPFVALRDQYRASIIIAGLRAAYGRVLALAGCSAEKCDGAARNPKRGLGAWFGGGGALAAVAKLGGWLLRALFVPRATATRRHFLPDMDVSDRNDRIQCANPVAEDHLATLHGIKPLEATGNTNANGKQRQAADGAVNRGNRD